MNRLTKYETIHGEKRAFPIFDSNSVSDIFDKLAAYEDTGLEPEEVAMLKAKDKKNDSIMGDLMRAICAEQKENAELKRLLSLAVQGFKYIDKYFGCGGCAENWQDCPYNAGKIDVCTEHWKHADEAEKVLGGSENA